MGENERPAASDLALAIARGDADAETALIEHYGPGLSYVLRREFRRRDAAEDLYQETFRIVLERLREEGLDEPDKLAAFILGVARRLAKARRRAEARHVGATGILERMEDGAPSPCEQAIRYEQARAVRVAIQRLTVSRDRDLLTRRYLLDEDKQVICEDVGLDPELFNRTMHRARTRLKREIGTALLFRREGCGAP